MANPPLISVIITTYYRNEYLQDAIDSVYEIGYPAIELIVVDDSGEEHAQPVMNKYKDIIYIPLDENKGQNAALNIGLKNATGQYVQFLDDDDMLLPGKFTNQIDLLESSNEVGVAYCGVKMDTGETYYPDTAGSGNVIKKALQFELGSCVTSTMLVDKNIIDETAPLPTPPGATDSYMKIEFSQITNFDFVDEALVYKRDLKKSVGSSADAIKGQREIFSAYRDLYNQFDRSVFGVAYAKFHERSAEFYLSDQVWSVHAIWSFSTAMYWRRDLYSLALLIGSLFGRPGIQLVRKGMSLADPSVD